MKVFGFILLLAFIAWATATLLDLQDDPCGEGDPQDGMQL